MSDVKRRESVRSTHTVAPSRRRGYKKQAAELRTVDYYLTLKAKVRGLIRVIRGQKIVVAQRRRRVVKLLRNA